MIHRFFKKTSHRALAVMAASWMALSAIPSISLASEVASENAQILKLYEQAKAEKGPLTVYMGGDAPGQWDQILKGFRDQFPDIELNAVVDLSKYHEPRIDNQIANKKLDVDVAVLQTIHDFDRWKANGQLMQYKPIGWNKIYSKAKDPDGYWTGVMYFAFTSVVSKDALSPAGMKDFNARDLLDKKFKDKIILTFPNDDDAVLFGFKLLVDKYGWDWLKGIADQNPTYVRGVPSSSAGVASGKFLASIATAGVDNEKVSSAFNSREPFVAWAQEAAIFRNAKHPASAKLFLSWLTSATTQQYAVGSWTWPVRKDIAQPAWLKPITSYENADLSAFKKFMSDRAGVERFKMQLELYMKPVEGPDPASPDHPIGLHPNSSRQP